MNRSIRSSSQHYDGDDDAIPGAPPPMELSMVCTSVVELGAKVCFATFDEENDEIIVEECACSGDDLAVVAERYFTLVRPNLLLLGNAIVSNEGFLEVLTKPLPILPVADHEEQDNGEENQGNEPSGNAAKASSIPYRVLKSTAFDQRNCMALILQNLRVLSLIQRAQNSARRPIDGPVRQFQNSNRSFPISAYHMLGSVIDFDSQLQVKSVGALLSFLQSTLFKLDGQITVGNIRHAQSSKYMNLNATTIAALNIFSTEHHPLLASKGRGNSKEGSSLFSLLDRTKSRGGRQMLRNWMLKPLLDREEILMRQDGVELFTAPMVDCESAAGAIISLLKEVGPINQILNRLQKCAALPFDFVSLTRTLSAANEICKILSFDLLERLKPFVPPLGLAPPPGTEQDAIRASRCIRFLQKILQRCNTPVLDDLQERICACVDEESTYEARDTVCIRTGYSEKLDALKDDYSRLNEFLYGQRQKAMQQYPALGELAVVFFPQIGYLLGCQKEKITVQFHGEDGPHTVFVTADNGESQPLPPDFSHVCDNEDGLSYLKNEEMLLLDQDPGDLDGMIKDEEALIVSHLEDEILDEENDLRETFLALSELDCIISFAIVAKDRNYIRPSILPLRESGAPDEEDSQVVAIRNGRHPLQEILVDGDFIPNDTDISDEKRVNVVTGPNFSGKSCYCRQVGVLVYMAHIGSFLPCEAAQVSLFDQIFAQFSTVETCAVPQSSFQLDLTQMGTILRRSTPRTLVLVDEFGKGTSPASGIALLSAAIRKFTSVKATVVCTTHFLEVFSRRLVLDGENGIKALRMAVHVPRDRGEIAEPLFRLECGVADSSAGIICAKMAGLHRSVVARAQEIVFALKDGKQLEPCKDVQKAIVSKMLAPAANDALRTFLSRSSWANASNEEVTELLQKLEKVQLGNSRTQTI